MDTFAFIKLGMFIAIAIACAVAGIFFAKYLRDYKVFQFIYAKIRGRAAEADRIRRMQMREDFKKYEDIMNTDEVEKPSLISRIYKAIQMTGVITEIPGFSETTFLILFVFVGLLIFAGFSYKVNPLAGLFAMLGYAVIGVYSLSILTYSRRIKVETQLLDFVNMVATASRQYSNLTDILGATYEGFQQPLRGAMEACYIESRQTNNADLAIQHMKAKFDSVQLAFVLDNLMLCSKETGDYTSVAQDISKTVAIYLASHEKKQALLRNAKITLTVMAILSVVIVFALGEFVGGVSVLFSTTGGVIIAILILVLYFYGLNLKAE